MVFVIGDIVRIGRTYHKITRFFSDGTIGVDNVRVDPSRHRVDIIGHEHARYDTPYNGCRAMLHILEEVR